MPMRSKSQTTTNGIVGRRLSRKRPPTHPGEMLFEEFVKPLELTQTELARRLGVSYPRLNGYVSRFLVGFAAGLGSLARHEQSRSKGDLSAKANSSG